MSSADKTKIALISLGCPKNLINRFFQGARQRDRAGRVRGDRHAA